MQPKFINGQLNTIGSWVRSKWPNFITKLNKKLSWYCFLPLVGCLEFKEKIHYIDYDKNQLIVTKQIKLG